MLQLSPQLSPAQSAANVTARLRQEVNLRTKWLWVDLHGSAWPDTVSVPCEGAPPQSVQLEFAWTGDRFAVECRLKSVVDGVAIYSVGVQ